MKTANPQMTASADLLTACQAFLADPTTERDTRVLQLLQRDLRAAGYSSHSNGMFLEWGCLEHNVVDVYIDEGQGIIRIDPATSTVTAL